MSPPVIAGVVPSNLPVGSPATQVVVYGSNFADGAVIDWNGTPVTGSTCIIGNVTNFTTCSGATAIEATVPASAFASAGSATVTVCNPNPGGGISNGISFTTLVAPTGNTWVRKVPGITESEHIAWDANRGRLYASVGSYYMIRPNTVVAIDPIAAQVTGSAAANTNPNLLSISSDASYLWVGLDGSNLVQRYLLPGLTPDISIAVPNGQPAASLEAAPVSPHTVALVAPQSGVFVYDDATQRPTSFQDGLVSWLQWGYTDSVIYGNINPGNLGGGFAILNVTSSGASLNKYGGGTLSPIVTQFDRGNGLLYSHGAAYDPVQLTQVGQFDYPGGLACTADSSLGRYFCVTAHADGGTTVIYYKLYVFDLSTYAVISTTFFGTYSGNVNSSITGGPISLVRWGNAGLAVAAESGGSNSDLGGVFLIDGAVVNPNAAPDVTSGTASNRYAALTSMTPQVAVAGNGFVSVVINGTGFSPDSTACWNCSYLNFDLLPTTYVSPTQLNATIPLAWIHSTVPLEISVYDAAANLFSTNALTFTVLPASATTKIVPLNICGLSAAWDATSELLYVGTADYDGGYPNSVVGINGETGAVVKSQTVSPNPIFLSDGSQGQYLYAAYASATNLTQLSLPNLGITASGVLNSPLGGPWLAGDMKAAPVSPHATAVSMIDPVQLMPAGGVVIFDDGVGRPNIAQGPRLGADPFGTIAWSISDSLLTSAQNDNVQGPLYQLQVSSSGDSYLGTGSGNFNDYGDEIHSDFGNGLIYSDDGNVANPISGAFVGSYGSSGLVAPDSSLNRVFILGQTSAQYNTLNYTIQSFNQKTFALVSSIQLALSGTPIELVRWGTSGLAVLTVGGLNGLYANGLGMTYLISDTTFVSASKFSGAEPMVADYADSQELVQRRWKRLSKRELLRLNHEVIGGTPRH